MVLTNDLYGFVAYVTDHDYCKNRRRTVQSQIRPPDHNYGASKSPRTLSSNTMAAIARQKKRIEILKQRVRRMKKKVKSMDEVMKEVKSKFSLSENGDEMLTVTGSAITKDFFSRMYKQKKTGRLLRTKYTSALRQFALTLNFYSSKAYKYVRNTFDLALPHPTVIQSWYRSIGGEPGFTNESFDLLKKHTQNSSQPTICSLTIDEMSIRKHVEWDGKQFRGYVDIGTGVQDDTVPPATEALVFMVVAVNSNWKLPVAYFLLDGMNGKDKANLLQQCLCRLDEAKIIITSVTCDGASSNMAMFRELGASTDPDNLKVSFDHNQHKVYIIPDVCHMLKLLRNTFASQTMVDGDGHQIKWTYIEELHKLQEAEGLRAANKLKTAHIEWSRQKMKVNLAAQVISSSVANALEFCQRLNLPQFKGCEATVKFLRIFDRLFDILNSRNPLAKNFKAPMTPGNKHFWHTFLHNTAKYIRTLKNTNGTPMTQTNKKTAFIGFLIAINSITAIFQDYVTGTSAQPPSMRYLLTYKFSQDHLELFFGCIRCHLGCNNNPTCQQFVAAYKRLLVQNEIKASSNTNCMNLQHVSILAVESSSIKHLTDSSGTQVTVCQTVQQNITEREPMENEHDYADTPNIVTLSKYCENTVYYIAGYVARNILKHLPCQKCAEALTTTQNIPTANSILLQIADRGGLKKPSKAICFKHWFTTSCWLAGRLAMLSCSRC